MRRDRRRPLTAVLCTVVLGAGICGVANRAFALHRETPGAVRLTRSATHFNTSGRLWGNDVAFASNIDLAFNGNNTQQIFVYNHFQWVCQNGTPEPGTEARCPSPPIPFLQQVTFGPGNPDNPSVSQAKGTCQLDPNIPCAVDGDCGTTAGQCFKDNQWVAFDALGSFAGGTGAQTARRQIFLFNRDSQALIRVTNAVDGDSTHPSVNVQGGIVVFQSTAALTGVPNPSGAPQIFVFERRSGLIRQITFGQAPSVNPTINLNGSMIAFQSRADLLRSGVDTGLYQIFWAVYDKVDHTAMVRRLTNGDGDSINANLGGSSRTLVFESVATNLAGVAGGSQIYRSSRLDLTPLTVEQVTFQSAFGDCHYPSLSPAADRIAFICDGDPLANGTDGPRAFAIDMDDGTLRQLTGAGQVQGPISHHLGRWFVSLSTTSTLTGEEPCGFQLFAIDYYDAEPGHWAAAKGPGELPPDVEPPDDPGGTKSNVIGKVSFVLQREGAGAPGSHVNAVQRDGGIQAPLVGEGFLPLVIGAPDLVTHLNSVRLDKGKISLPPIPIPNVGYLCITPDSDGLGSLDCDGGNMGGTVVVTQDHNVDETVDPACTLGCREGAACQRIWLEGPHQIPCPGECGDDGVCVGGFNEGQPCSMDLECRPIDCSGGRYGVCNGPVQSGIEGTSRPGEMHINLPVRMTLAREPGIDGVQCTADDVNVATNLKSLLRLTTGGQDTTIYDRDNAPDVSLLGEISGAPFDCASLRAGVVLGSQLIGVLPFLDLPTPIGTRDMILQIVLDPRIEPDVCDRPCTSVADCDDGNPCNGLEACVNSVCKAGTPKQCSDGNPCNGLEVCDPETGTCLPGSPCNDGDPCNGTETCNPVTGCQPGTPIECSNNDACDGLERCDPETLACLPSEPPDCDDQNPCTADSCDKHTGCVNVPIEGPCDDGTNCTTGDTCIDGECVGESICDDHDACNGVEGCIEDTLACAPGDPPDCDDFNDCTADACNPATGCTHTPIPGDCDDGSACTQGDTCVGGECVGTLKQCTDGNACNGLEECNPATGACVPGAPPVCDNGDSCPDSCDPQTGCVPAACGSTTIPQLNQAPICDGAFAQPDGLFPPNHKMVPTRIGGIVDPDGDSVAIEIESISQDEPLDQGKRARACPDGAGVGTSTAWLRAERRGKGDGRVYHVTFVARDGRGKSCQGEVTACAPHGKSNSNTCGDQGALVDSTQPLCDKNCAETCGVEVRVARLPTECESGPFPKYVQSRIDQAHKLVAKGAGLVGRGRAKTMIAAGIRMLQKTARAVFKAEREGLIDPDCSTLLTDKLQDAVNAAKQALADLKKKPTS